MKKVTAVLLLILTFSLIMGISVQAVTANLPNGALVQIPENESVLFENERLVVKGSAVESEEKQHLRSALLFDSSGSMRKEHAYEFAALSNVLSEANDYDYKIFFDSKGMSFYPDYVGGGDSNICEAFHAVAKFGVNKIDIITDAEQYPLDYSGLKDYKNIDTTIYMVYRKESETEEHKNFFNALKNSMTDCSLKVVWIGEEKDIYLDDYVAPVVASRTPSVNISVEEKENGNNCLWCLALIIAVLFAALFDFIHELIKKRRMNVPLEAVNAIRNGAHLLLDVSGSMSKFKRAAKKACIKASSENPILCFGDDKIVDVPIGDLNKINLNGGTPGWEALEYAVQNDLEEIVLISDLKFNGKEFNSCYFGRKFKKITVVLPRGYQKSTLPEIEYITEELKTIEL